VKQPKAKIEYPDQVRTRVEEARRKLKKLNGTLPAEDGCVPYDDTATASAVPVTFPDFPKLNLSILNRVSQDRAQGQRYNSATLALPESIAVA
jgi:hypothetical protein